VVPAAAMFNILAGPLISAVAAEIACDVIKIFLPWNLVLKMMQQLYQFFLDCQEKEIKNLSHSNFLMG
jgi:hypothetical protein